MIFREYDIRGIFNDELNENIVFRIGQELARQIKITDPEPAVMIGYDARLHSETLLKWLSAGFSSENVKIYNLGLVPTGVAYFATFLDVRANFLEKILPDFPHDHKKIAEIFPPFCKNSVMITGSHNPKNYNGFKITLDQKPFFGAKIRALGEKIEKNPGNFARVQDLVLEKIDALKFYEDYMTHEFATLKNLPEKIAIDYGNGAAGVALPQILKNLQIHAENLYEKPDGNFPNHHPDPSVPENLQDLRRVMREKNINFGLAFDGDGDRIAFIAGEHMFKGDELGIIFAREIAKKLPRPVILGEVKSSKNFYDEVNKIGRAVMYKAGHSNIKMKLAELGGALGIEISGHMFFHDRFFGFDDALYAALRILELVKKFSAKDFSEMISALPKLFTTEEENIATTDEKKGQIVQNLSEFLVAVKNFQDLGVIPQNLDKKALQILKTAPKISEIITIDGLRVVFLGGWGLVRQSNTTPLLVTRYEARNASEVQEYRAFLRAAIEIFL